MECEDHKTKFDLLLQYIFKYDLDKITKLHQENHNEFSYLLRLTSSQYSNITPFLLALQVNAVSIANYFLHQCPTVIKDEHFMFGNALNISVGQGQGEGQIDVLIGMGCRINHPTLSVVVLPLS